MNVLFPTKVWCLLMLSTETLLLFKSANFMIFLFIINLGMVLLVMVLILTNIASPLLQRSCTPLNVDSINTPRRLVHSIQEPNNADSKFSKKPMRMYRSLSMNEFDWSPNARFDQDGYFIWCEL